MLLPFLVDVKWSYPFLKFHDLNKVFVKTTSNDAFAITKIWCVF